MDIRTQIDADYWYHLILAGYAIFTAKSRKTGKHFTFKVRRSNSIHSYWYVYAQGIGGSWKYFGFIDSGGFHHDPNEAKIFHTNPAVQGFAYVLRKLWQRDIPDVLELKHVGRCMKCHKRLTTPESIERGLGPHCYQELFG